MARKPEVLAVAPALPTGSVDFNAFHDAIANGASAEQAVSAATRSPDSKTETPPVADDAA